MKKSITLAFAIISVFLTFVPESLFEIKEWISDSTIKNMGLSIKSNILNVIVSKVIFFITILIIVFIVRAALIKIRRKISIKGDNYVIQIEYGNILNIKNCKKVINFDECFTCNVGDNPGDVKPTSICGQYLKNNPNINVDALISNSNIVAKAERSKYKNKICYESGSLIPNGDDLLMSFAPLDGNGLGSFSTRDSYLKCLDLLWKQIDTYYCQKDVCIPILGSGITRFEDGSGASISQKELLQTIIYSYMLSSHKLKSPHKLRIVCMKSDDFSINDISYLFVK
jgi:hypothetical protein